MAKPWCACLLVLVACGHGGGDRPTATTAPPARAEVAGPTCDAVGTGHEAAYARGAELVEPYLVLADRPPVQRPGKEDDLRRGVACFELVLPLVPGNWTAMWLKGKAHQALDERDLAVQAFRAAYQLEQNNPDVGRELVQALLDTSANREAATIANEVAERHPEDAGLVANLAVALLLDAQIERAQQVVERAHQLAPADPVTLALRQLIDDVASGRRPQPTSLRELEGR